MIEKTKQQIKHPSSVYVFTFCAILVAFVEFIFLISFLSIAPLTIIGLWILSTSIISILVKFGINLAIIRKVRRLKETGISDNMIMYEAGRIFQAPVSNNLIVLFWFWFFPSLLFTYITVIFYVILNILWNICPAQDSIIIKELARLNTVPEHPQMEAGDIPYRTIKEKSG